MAEANAIMEQYLVGVDEHVRALRDEGLVELGEKFTLHVSYTGALAERNLQIFASRLDVEGELILARMDSNPAYVLLGVWRRRPGSTVGMLMEVLLRLERNDCVELLDKLRHRKL